MKKRTNRRKKEHLQNSESILTKSFVKVGWEELLYDLIFIIVISKMSEVIVTTSIANFDIKFIITEFILYMSIIFMWFSKVMSANRIHILEHKLNIKISKHKFITYVQLTVLIVLFSQLKENIIINYYIYLLIVTTVFSILTTIALRNYLINYYSGDKKALWNAFIIYKSLENRKKIELNMSHLLERLGVLMILFLGEILNCIFNNGDNTVILLFSVIILLNTFSANIRIIEVSEEKEDSKVLKSTIYYFIKCFILYLIFIVAFEYSSYYKISIPYVFTGLILINKLYQRLTLLKLNDITINKVELITLLYFIAMVIAVYCLRISNVYIIIFIILVSVAEKLRNEYYKEVKKVIL